MSKEIRCHFPTGPGTVQGFDELKKGVCTGVLLMAPRLILHEADIKIFNIEYLDRLTADHIHVPEDIHLEMVLASHIVESLLNCRIYLL